MWCAIHNVSLTDKEERRGVRERGKECELVIVIIIIIVIVVVVIIFILVAEPGCPAKTNKVKN